MRLDEGEVENEEMKQAVIKNMPGSNSQYDPWDILIREFLVNNVLDLRGKGLTEISSKLWRFDQITTLDLSQNQILAIPEEIISLKNLKTIRVQNSYLKKLPLTLLQMPSLVNMEFANNQLTSFYDELDVRRD
jgi:Leucine-rich repeat (LRR) protein